MGSWKLYAGQQNGGPVEEVPPGGETPDLIFHKHGMLSLTCDMGKDGTWTLDEETMVIHAVLAGSIELEWVIVSLAGEELVFMEAGDTFYFEPFECEAP